ncbi:hypothetical protein V6N11_013080 [Hibiscus sabdariffa]|uniref:Uncharacterized protein n=2 Tax=Hibiscus sabdariffa TaxID=183260 RepID=A0ABR2A657_9ROSI
MITTLEQTIDPFASVSFPCVISDMVLVSEPQDSSSSQPIVQPMIDGSQASHTPMTIDNDFRASSSTHRETDHVSGSLIQETVVQTVDHVSVSAQSSIQSLPLQEPVPIDPGSESVSADLVHATISAPTRRSSRVIQKPSYLQQYYCNATDVSPEQAQHSYVPHGVEPLLTFLSQFDQIPLFWDNVTLVD